MELRRTETGFALYKEKEAIGHCTLHPAAQGAALAALTIDPAWRRKGYGSYLLKEVLRSFGGYDREAATVFTTPLPADCAEMAFWAKFGFAAEGPQLVRRRTPDRRQIRAGLPRRAAGAPAPVRGRHLRQRRRHGLPVPSYRTGGPCAGL